MTEHTYIRLGDVQAGDTVRRLGTDHTVVRVETVKGQVRLTFENTGHLQNKPNVQVRGRKQS